MSFLFLVMFAKPVWPGGSFSVNKYFELWKTFVNLFVSLIWAYKLSIRFRHLCSKGFGVLRVRRVLCFTLCYSNCLISSSMSLVRRLSSTQVVLLPSPFYSPWLALKSVWKWMWNELNFVWCLRGFSGWLRSYLANPCLTREIQSFSWLWANDVPFSKYFCDQICGIHTPLVRRVDVTVPIHDPV